MKQIFTRAFAARQIAVIAVILAVINSHFYWTRILVNGHCRKYSRYDYFARDIFPWIDWCLASLIPFLIILVTNFSIVGKVIDASHIRKVKFNVRKNKKLTSMTAILLSISFIFLLTMVLFWCSLLYHGLERTYHINWLGTASTFCSTLTTLSTFCCTVWAALVSGESFSGWSVRDAASTHATHVLNILAKKTVHANQSQYSPLKAATSLTERQKKNCIGYVRKVILCFNVYVTVSLGVALYKILLFYDSFSFFVLLSTTGTVDESCGIYTCKLGLNVLHAVFYHWQMTSVST